MQERKFKLGLARFPYGGNGALSSEVPQIGDWLYRLGRWHARNLHRLESEMWSFCRSDTPIPMVRNAAAFEARRDGVDLLVMVDSDMHPDIHRGFDSQAHVFIEKAFELFCEHYDKGPCVIGAPYVGPPPHPITGGNAVPYVLQWDGDCNDEALRSYSLKLMDRFDAGRRTGIEKVAAIGTGLMLFDMRLFADGAMIPPWFDYEWTNEPYNTGKASTEDVFFTRNCSLCGYPVYCLWNCWAGHAKPAVEGKPQRVSSDMVGEQYAKAVKRGYNSSERLTTLNPTKTTNEVLEDLGLAPGGNGTPAPMSPGAASKVPMRITDDEWHAMRQQHADGTVSVGWPNDSEDHKILEKLVQDYAAGCLGALLVVEIGSWVGQSAIAIGKGIRAAESDGRVICVDTWMGSPADPTGPFATETGRADLIRTFRGNLQASGMADMMGAIISDSLTAAAAWPHGPVDIVFIDADHRYEAVKADILAWMPHLRPGGLICGHDYHDDAHPGVTQAVDELFPEVQCEGNIWWVETEEAVSVPADKADELREKLEAAEDGPPVLQRGPVRTVSEIAESMVPQVSVSGPGAEAADNED